MSFAIFDENYYLRKNPDVAAAVKAGFFSSGKEHFQLFGLSEKRTNVSLYWSEDGYFESTFVVPQNYDVGQAIFNGKIPSALAHFIQFGETEGRIFSNSFYDEKFYLQQNPDVANAVLNKTFTSGYSHFIQYGITENRRGSAFNEKAYLSINPDVATAVSAGVFPNGLEHYKDFGQREGRFAFLSGSSGSDFVTALETGKSIVAGVSVEVNPQGNTIPTSLGIGENDTLIGSGARDRFLLGYGRSDRNSNVQKFYIGKGDADYAVISNFDIDGDIIEPGSDTIQLAGNPNEYVIEKATNFYQTKIYAIANNSDSIGANNNNPQLDLIAVVSTGNLSVVNVDSINETFTLSATSFLT